MSRLFNGHLHAVSSTANTVTYSEVFPIQLVMITSLNVVKPIFICCHADAVINGDGQSVCNGYGGTMTLPVDLERDDPYSLTVSMISEASGTAHITLIAGV